MGGGWKRRPLSLAAARLSHLVVSFLCCVLPGCLAVQELNIQISRKGKPIIHRSTVTGPGTSATGNGDAVVPMQHDRTKQLPISPTEPHAFLQQLGMQMADGRVKADWQDKFTQVRNSHGRCRRWIVIEGAGQRCLPWCSRRLRGAARSSL